MGWLLDCCFDFEMLLCGLPSCWMLLVGLGITSSVLGVVGTLLLVGFKLYVQGQDYGTCG